MRRRSPVARVDRLHPFLTQAERYAFLMGGVTYLASISDYRGFDSVSGEGARLARPVVFMARRQNLSVFLLALYYDHVAGGDETAKRTMLPAVSATLESLPGS
jgi:hypothetical protein